MSDKMREEFERDHGPLSDDKDMQKYFARHECAMRWAWQAAQDERKDKPAECVNGCPDKQVCDYCQGVAAIMPCGASVTNVYEAYDAGKKAAQSVPVAQECDHLWMTGPMVKGGHPVEGPFVVVCSKCGEAPSLSNDDPLAAELERLRKDAERGRLLIDRGEWFRFDHDTPDSYALLAVRLPYSADLSCKPTREDAIDAAIAATKEKK